MLRLGKEILIFDGGMGSELARAGYADGAPEELNFTQPDLIRGIHRSYGCADFITTNTFGLNRIKYRGAHSVAEVAKRAAELARAAGKQVFFDIGPTGAMLRPVGTLSFDEAYDVFREVVEASRDLVDGYLLETFSDLYEIKAALLAVKENSALPVFATMTFGADGRTLMGTTPEIAVLTLEGLGADAVGVNCSLGPDETEPVVRRMLACAHVPVLVQPNLGLPVVRDGKTEYPLSDDTFLAAAERFAAMGVSVLGGCCGTTPALIEKLCALRGRKTARPAVPEETVVCSARRAVRIGEVAVCGERLNPTGKKALKEALLRGDFGYLADEAIRQEDAGADLLDLNVGVPGIGEAVAMRRALETVQEYVDLPVQIDSSDPAAIEAGARYCNGIPLINSVNGDEAVMDRVFPIAKKYGAVVLGLTMDPNGVPKTAEERFRIAERIVRRAEAYGIPRRRIMIDTLTLTASAEQALVRETLRALDLVAGLGVKTALGVSNVSFGLPNRPLLNRTFLVAALAHGLNMPIINPLDGEMMGAVRAFGVLDGSDRNAARYIGLSAAVPLPAAPRTAGEELSLYDCVKRGRADDAAACARREAGSRPPLGIVNDVLVKALEEVGAEYEKGTLFLPQLIASAEAAKAAFSVLGEFLPQKTGKGRIVLATVRGDVHDIGKNIVKVVAQSYGYEVCDLGKDVPAEEIVRAVRELSPIAVGLSALMTTTVPRMEETVAALRVAGCGAKIFVGGAVLNADLARRMGADFYTENALDFVRKLETL